MLLMLQFLHSQYKQQEITFIISILEDKIQLHLLQNKKDYKMGTENGRMIMEFEISICGRTHSTYFIYIGSVRAQK